MELEGRVENGIIVLDQPELLPEGAKVKVVVQSPTPDGKKLTLAERLLSHAGKVHGLPSDLAEQHDHYIHGTPKR